MAISNQTIQRKVGFFHALGKVNTENGKNAFEEKYKSSHNIRSNEIWVSEVPFVRTFASASQVNQESSVVRQIGSSSNPSYLYPLAGSNGESWFLDTGEPVYDSFGFKPSSSWIRPLINPSDVIDSQGEPSTGYRINLYKRDGSGLSYNNTYWDVDYYSGLIRFETGRTPFDSGQQSGIGYTFSKLGLLSAFEEGGDTSAREYVTILI